MRKYPPSRLAGRSRSLSSRVVRDVTRKPRDWNEATAARSLSASRTPVSSRPSPSQALYAYLGIVALPYGLPGLHSLCPSAQEQGAHREFDSDPGVRTGEHHAVDDHHTRGFFKTLHERPDLRIPTPDPQLQRKGRHRARRPALRAGRRRGLQKGNLLHPNAAGCDGEIDAGEQARQIGLSRDARQQCLGVQFGRGVLPGNLVALLHQRHRAGELGLLSPRLAPGQALPRTWGKNTTSVSTIAMAKPIPTCRNNRAPGRRLGFTAPFLSGVP